MQERLQASDLAEGQLRPHESRPLRLLFAIAGTLCIALGVLGAFLPVLPTTPFLLAAAVCYSRSSPRLYNTLLGNRLFGPPIRDWLSHGSITRPTKIMAVALILVSFGTTIALFVTPWFLRLVLAALGLAMVAYLLRMPTRPLPD